MTRTGHATAQTPQELAQPLTVSRAHAFQVLDGEKTARAVAGSETESAGPTGKGVVLRGLLREIIMLFANRDDAGRRLATRLKPLRGQPVVLGLPREGIPVAAQVARALGAPLDVIVVRKIGVPFQPELAMGQPARTGAGHRPPGHPG